MWALVLERRGPALPAVQHTKNLDRVAVTTVGDDIRGSPDNELAGSGPTTRPPAIGKAHKAADGSKDMLHLLRCRGRLVACDVGS